MENSFHDLCSELSAYRENDSNDTPRHKRHVEEKYKNRKYCTLFWFMLFLYVAQILIPTV